jgi:hypothetical protein
VLKSAKGIGAGAEREQVEPSQASCRARSPWCVSGGNGTSFTLPSGEASSIAWSRAARLEALLSTPQRTELNAAASSLVAAFFDLRS